MNKTKILHIDIDKSKFIYSSLKFCLFYDRRGVNYFIYLFTLFFFFLFLKSTANIFDIHLILFFFSKKISNMADDQYHEP